MTWTDWIAKHSTRFGMSNDKDIAMLRDWSGTFNRKGYSPDELSTASDRLLDLPEPPRFRDAMLFALDRLVLDARMGRFERPQAPPPSEACSLCGGDGLLGVPDYVAMARHEKLWHRAAPFKTQTVYCRCPLGLWKAKQPRRSLQSLAEYEQANEGCDWRRDLAQHRLEQEAWAKARGHAGALDREMGRLMRKWKEKREVGDGERD